MEYSLDIKTEVAGICISRQVRPGVAQKAGVRRWMELGCILVLTKATLVNNMNLICLMKDRCS